MQIAAKAFEHTQSAHCESGATSNLLRHAGLPVTEAMVFGIGSGLFFVHCPWVKLMDLPLTSYRSFPGTIFKKTCKRLNVSYHYQSFRDPMKGRRALDELVAGGRAVGVRTNIFWLPYIPERFRFQFNGHNIVVFGRTSDNDYVVSDPIMDRTSTCPARSMNRARFAAGTLAPRGLVFFPTPTAGAKTELEPAIRAGIRETVGRMLNVPLPFFGVRGIRYMSRRIARWPTKIADPAKLSLNLANVVRMQEEIGTGGGGFRYLYAAFLQESAELTHAPMLAEAARRLTDSGNLWRDFATLAVQQAKGRATTPYERLPALLIEIAKLEEEVFMSLRRRYL
jgi:hypothetical protein